jgi:RNA polymerase sigma factor FliA
MGANYTGISHQCSDINVTVENISMNESLNLWNVYINEKNIFHRNNLFHFYSPWVKKIVSGFYLNNRNPLVQWNDCMQNAAIALIQSIERYDITQGVPFEGYAYIRIKGSLLNMYNKEDHLQSDALDQLVENPDDFVDIDVSVDVDFDCFVDSVISVAFSQLLDVVAHRVSDTSIDPLDLQILYHEEKMVVEAIDKLDDKLRFIISSHYQHFMSFKQIAVSLGLSKSRVSQLHSEALNKLRIIYEAK